MKPTISIIMPVKNAADYLDQCLDSIVHQSFKDWELVAVDDGSTDHSREVIGSYEDSDPRIKLLNNQSEGIVPALKTAFENASGSFITRMDADDVMPSKKLEVLLNALANRKDTVITGKVKYFSDKKVSEGYVRYEKWLNDVVENDWFQRDLFRECVVASPNWMVHRSCFEEKVNLADLAYPEDYDMVFEWLSNGFNIEGVNKITHLWREHDQRTSRNSEHYQQKAFFELKTNRFIEQFKDEMDGIQLIGKGEKGRLVARHFDHAHINYQWFDLNPGKDQASVMALEDSLTILSNWPKDERIQEDIQHFLRKKNLVFGKNLWLF